MRRALAGALAAAALLVLVVAAPATAAASTTASLMVPPPPGFTPLAPPAGVDGPVTAEMVQRLTGDKAAPGVSSKDLKDALADSYARSYVNQTTRDALVMFGYHLRSDEQAVGFVRGALNSAESDDRLKVVPGSPPGIALFDVSDKARNANGQMALVRQGRYVFQFLVVAASGTGGAPAGVAMQLARSQLGRLPEGSRTFQHRSKPVSPLVVGLLVVVVAGAAVVLTRGRRGGKPPAPPTPDAVEPPAPEPPA